MSASDKAAYDVQWLEAEGAPVARITGGAGHPQAYHPVQGWRLKSYVYLDGSLRLLSTEFGSRFFNLAPFHDKACKAELHWVEEAVELDYNRLLAGGARVKRELSPCAFRAETQLPRGTLTQEVVLRDLHARDLLMRFRWTPAQPGAAAPRLHLPFNVPAGTPCECSASKVGFDAGPYGRLFYHAAGAAVRCVAEGLVAELDRPLVIRAGYAPQAEDSVAPTEAQVDQARAQMAQFWRERFARLRAGLSGEAWVEARNALVAMATTATWDEGRQTLCCTNGGLYTLDHRSTNLDQPHNMYSFRDGNQVAFALVESFPELCRGQVLRNFRAYHRQWGIPQLSNAYPGSKYVYKAPGGGADPHQSADLAIASDQVYWLIIALTEYVRGSGDRSFMGVQVADAHGQSATVREHLIEMLRFADEKVGYGPHGLCRFLSGDWNDYLQDIGPRGRGESFMNTALSIISKSRLAAVYESMDDAGAAGALRAQAQELRERLKPFLHGRWFPRAFDDSGKLVGDDADRVYLDVQPWVCLALCGSPSARREALLTSLERCQTPIGPRLIDRALTSSEWPGRTHCTYPPGTGENGGIWWIVAYWMALALDQEGLADQAEQTIASCSLGNHHRQFPAEWWSPFMAPDGIDAPPAATFGKAQQPASGFDRESNPLEVAKWAYQLYFATHRGAAGKLCW